MSSSSITGAALPLILNGKEYQLKPLTDKDISELDEYVQTRMLRAVRLSLRDEPRDVYDREMSLAHRQAATITWMSGEGAKVIGTLDGLARVLWQSIKHSHPELTHEEVKSMLLDPKNMEDNMREFEDVFHKANRSTLERTSAAFKKAASRAPTKGRKRKSTGA